VVHRREQRASAESLPLDEGLVVAGRYRITQRLDADEFGPRYVASDLDHPRSLVLVREPGDAIANDQPRLRKLKQQLEPIVGLTLPHTLTLQAVQTVNDRLVIIAEWRDAPTLAALIDDEGPQRAEDIEALLEPIAKALDEAHARGFSHGAISPHRIRVDASGEPWLAEFASARALRDQTIDAGQAVGDPSMTPEELSGQPAEPRQDIYGLAAAIYYCLTGHDLYDDDDQLPTRIMREPVDPIDAEDSRLWKSVLEALSKNPTDRPQSAAQLMGMRAGGNLRRRQGATSAPGAQPNHSADTVIIDRPQDTGEGEVEIEIGVEPQGLPAPNLYDAGQTLQPIHDPAKEAADRKKAMIFAAVAIVGIIAIITGVVIWSLQPAPPPAETPATDIATTAHDPSDPADPNRREGTDASTTPRRDIPGYGLVTPSRRPITSSTSNTTDNTDSQVGTDDPSQSTGVKPLPIVELQTSMNDDDDQTKVIGTPNTIGITMVPIQPGRFLTGSDEFETGRHSNEFRRDIELTRSYLIAAHEVTRGQFAQFVNATNYVTDAEKAVSQASPGDASTWRTPGFEQEDSHPVVCVSYNDATAFCQWLTTIEGQTYRLPTEAQWEYASRAGSSKAFHYGDYSADLFRYDNYDDESVFTQFTHRLYADGVAMTSPVGTFRANTWGLFDVHGNVREWVADWYKRDTSGESAVDPVGPRSGTQRTVKGGSYADSAAGSRSAKRQGHNPDESSPALGFRVVAEIE